MLLINRLKKIAGISAVCIIAFPSYANKLSLAEAPLIQQYIQEISQVYQFDLAELTALFQQADINIDLLNYFHYAYEKKPWYQYRERFVTPERVEQGIAFWQKNKLFLDKAQTTYGVPPQIIISIIGVETNYGLVQGDYSVFNTLTTLAFYYPERAAFFRQELTEYLLLTREQKLSALEIKGSYAGAMGIAQFMPSTYRHYAVGYSKPTAADLMTHPEDAIMSIAHYLYEMKWQPHQPVAKPIPYPPHTKAIITLEMSPNSYAFWRVYNNFHSIMRYNPRIDYAMAVYQLSEIIKNGYETRTNIASRGPHTRSITLLRGATSSKSG